MGCHSFEGDTHYIDRSKCIQCGKCVQSCEYGAVKLCGKTMSAGEVMKIALADKAFYVSSGGGITISGGEPLLQSDFVLAILSLAKENGIHTCIETSGAVQFDIIKKVQPYVDLFLFDIKETDEQNHIKYTGISNRLPMENIRKLDELGASVKMRCPIIPGGERCSAAFSKAERAVLFPKALRRYTNHALSYARSGKSRTLRS